MPLATLLNAFVPVLGLLAIGFVSRRRDLVQDGFWTQAERLTYYLLMPALLVGKLAGLEAGTLPAGRIAIAVVGALLIAAAALALLRLVWRPAGAVFTSVVQGGLRFNTYIGLALVAPLYRPAGLEVAALVVGIMVATINVLCVSAFALCLHDGGPRLAAVCRQLVRNPLLIAAALGLAMQGLGLGLPVGLDGLADALGAAALPLGVMAVGAALARLETAHLPPATPFTATALVKFALLPGVSLALCAALDLDALTTAVIVLLQAMPTAPSAYVLARQLGGDHDLMASLIAGQTVAACVLLPLALAAGVIAV
ncbi:AEC family transporter [Caenispirillum salinarum]|uniref:AEC family transporter n=1 Tax=Caenispirillum salinarum TaxID=859058 RepID=UPI00384AB0A9